ncbi:MAG: TRAP transporter small permease subunit, partial [Pyramidobacter sp.]|nr:TRAP transporter small permease subunit [Pyramidobacter sp.]
MKTALLFLWNTLLRLQRIVMLLTICITTLAVFIEVIMRYIFKTPLVGIEELAAYVAFWLYFIGGTYGSYERSHISADMSSLVFKNKVSYARSHTVTSLITTGVCVYAIPWAWE